jgi:poly-gamma-glutamate synthesis protein (capsule biosynthesis protein)
MKKESKKHNQLKISFLGDVVPGGILTYFRDEESASSSVLEKLRESDLVAATLESPFGSAKTITPDKKNIIYSPVNDFFRLKELNISVVSLANNHIMDTSVDGFKATLDLLDKNGILYCGAGMNLSEARKPAIKEIKGFRIGFLGYCKKNYRFVGKVHAANENSPGVAPLEENLILEDITLAKEKCDFLYLMLHWGIEYTWLPTPENMDMAKLFIDKGADGIIGGHPHRVQPCLFYKGKPVFYSLGNFLFPNQVITPPKLMDYPDEVNAENFTTLPEISKYIEVKNTSLRVWPKLSRIGMIASITIKYGTQRRKVLFTFAHKYKSVVSSMRSLPSGLLKLFLTGLGYGIRLPVYRTIFHKILKLH